MSWGDRLHGCEDCVGSDGTMHEQNAEDLNPVVSRSPRYEACPDIEDVARKALAEWTESLIERSWLSAILIGIMKTTVLCARSVVGLSVLTATLVVGVSADQPTPAPKGERNYTGTVVAVDPQEHELKLKGFLFSKAFSLGDTCTYALLDEGAGNLGDVRLGQKVTVHYENAAGVLVAGRVEQQPLRCEGTVKEVDPKTRVLTVRRRIADKTFRIADGCHVTLRDGKPGTVADVQPGEQVTVTYEVPGRHPTARQIDQTSAKFTGSLTAIDLNTRTVKAKSLLDSRKFNLADRCAIVLDGKVGGRMADLKPGDRLTFSYNEVNGVHVVNRIATSEGSPEPATARAE